MNKFDKLYNALINESIIDFPRNSLDSSVWEFPEDGHPIMHPAIKIQIMKGVEELDSVIPVTKAYAIGSILTKQYDPNSDIDINVEVNPEDVSLIGRERVFNLLKVLNNQLAIGTTHPIRFYLVQGEYDIDKTQAAYDVANEKWLKEPEFIDVSVQTYVNQFQSAVNSIDAISAELRRNIIDFERLNAFSPKQLGQLKAMVNEKLSAIEADISALVQSYKQVRTLRNLSFERELTPQEIRKYGKRYKLPENIVYKLLERYYYIDFINKLHALVKDRNLKKDDVGKIKQLGKDLWK